MKFLTFNIRKFFDSFGSLSQPHEKPKNDPLESSPIPTSAQDAHLRLNLILSQRAAINELSHEEFMQGWTAMAYIAPGLNPDEALNKDCGWPSAWKEVAAEAFRRFSSKEITKDELYPHPPTAS
ncbi:hypothetical protein N8670_04200 [Akkermansiaceae bacterium]|nr:hypothetical protein [Akkermansiaceae bacterium]MDB4272589.1 hypothetical protein [bacterium]